MIFEVRASIKAPTLVGRRIPEALRIELRKAKYRRAGIELLSIEIQPIGE